jgi:hypothetical protein
MNFTKDNILLLRHGLDVMVRAEAQGVSQGGLEALSNGPAAIVIGSRLTMAVELGEMLKAEYVRLDEEEKAADKAAAEAAEAGAAAAPAVAAEKSKGK